MIRKIIFTCFFITALSVTSITGCTNTRDETAGLTVIDGFLPMVWIPAGTFIMGSPESEPSRNMNEIQHQVTINAGFYMSVHQVTQKQWKELMGEDEAWQSLMNQGMYGKEYGIGDDNPMYYINWYDAIEFCNKLSEIEGLTVAYRLNEETRAVEIIEGSTGYRLPTEAQWEYACRGHYPNKEEETNTMPFGVGDGTKITYELANFHTFYPYDISTDFPGQYKDIEGAGYLGKTSPVGSYAPNNYGLYDMHGNVWEWCLDWFGAYSGEAPVDPQGPDTGENRVLRGGCWDNIGAHIRSAYRGLTDPEFRGDIFGLRPVRR